VKLKKAACIVTFFILGITIISCTGNYKLKKNELKYIPYKGNEILVFRSSKNRMDTIFLKGMSIFNGCGDPLSLFPDKCEGIGLNCTRTDPNYDRYLEGKRLVEMVATSRRETHISFDIVLKGSWFYSLGSYSLAQFENMPNSELTIGSKTYNDVKVFEASEYAKQYENRNNYAERFYWSTGDGFLGLDRKDEKWRLFEKVLP
jgi:hypothetical protein